MFNKNLDIQSSKDRARHVRKEIARLGEVTTTTAEAMATYILYGKDSNGRNAFQNGDCVDFSKRYRTQRTRDDTLLSLDAISESYSDGIASVIAAPLTSPRTPVPREAPIVRNESHAAIPGMTELWDAIDAIKHRIALLSGEIPPADSETSYLAAHAKDTDSTIYHLRHLLISKLEEQYALRDAYQPHMPAHYSPAGSSSPTIDWSSDSSYVVPADQWQSFCGSPHIRYGGKSARRAVASAPRTSNGDYLWTVRHHTFDYENPKHWRFLLHHASSLRAELRERPETWGRALTFDLERYVAAIDLPPDRLLMLRELFDGKTLAQIADSVEEYCGKRYSQNHISVIINNDIPKKLATHVIREKLLRETTNMCDCIVCKKCGLALPRHPLFFSYASGDDFSDVCKDCRKEVTSKNGTTVPKVPSKKTYRKLFED